jgi:hypothetical protein
MYSSSRFGMEIKFCNVGSLPIFVLQAAIRFVLQNRQPYSLYCKAGSDAVLHGDGAAMRFCMVMWAAMQICAG